MKTYPSSMGSDIRVAVDMIATRSPNPGDGLPDIRLATMNLPANSVVIGPQGKRFLDNIGRYSPCCYGVDLVINHYTDFVMAKNEKPGNQETPQFDNYGGAIGYPKGSTGNPQDMMGKGASHADIPGYQDPGLHLARDAPMGPAKIFDNPNMANLFNGYRGPVLQFRLPEDYTIEGPLGNRLTFDPPHLEKYDESGTPHGVGGTYCIFVQQPGGPEPDLKLQALPPHAALRFISPDQLVVVRNGNVLPHFLEPGVPHEWSVREGHLDLYNSHGCYDIWNASGCHNLLPDIPASQVTQAIEQAAFRDGIPQYQPMNYEAVAPEGQGEQPAALEDQDEQTPAMEDHDEQTVAQYDYDEQTRALYELDEQTAAPEGNNAEVVAPEYHDEEAVALEHQHEDSEV